MMKCGFCAYEFDPAGAGAACRGCPLVKGCRLVRCPRCGYEMPPEAKLVTWLRAARDRHWPEHNEMKPGRPANDH